MDQDGVSIEVLRTAHNNAPVHVEDEKELDYVAQAYVIPRVKTKCKEMQ